MRGRERAPWFNRNSAGRAALHGARVRRRHRCRGRKGASTSCRPGVAALALASRRPSDAVKPGWPRAHASFLGPGTYVWRTCDIPVMDLGPPDAVAVAPGEIPGQAPAPPRAERARTGAVTECIQSAGSLARHQHPCPRWPARGRRGCPAWHTEPLAARRPAGITLRITTGRRDHEQSALMAANLGCRHATRCRRSSAGAHPRVAAYGHERRNMRPQRGTLETAGPRPFRSRSRAAGGALARHGRKRVED